MRKLLITALSVLAVMSFAACSPAGSNGPGENEDPYSLSVR